jgi:histidine triad (HIT) family protein
MVQQADCIFCKIVKGEIPAVKVFEDDAFVAFMDKFPKSTGHCQLIPKEHHRWVWDVPEIGRYMETARKIARAQRKAFGTEMIVSHVIGDEVAHAHIWLVPQQHTQNAAAKSEAAAELIRKNL